MQLTRNSIKYGGFFDIESNQRILADLEDQISANPKFWELPDLAAPILKKKKLVENQLERAAALKSCKDNLAAAVEFGEAGEDEFVIEAEKLVTHLEQELRSLEIQSLLSDELDRNDAVVTINAGAGGTESCDWAAMLLRMYLRFAERHGWETEVFDILDGEGAGIKNVTFGVNGEFAFGLLKVESGVHRLVRISPFDANARRHTSFVSVYVSAVVDDDIQIDIKDSDLKIDTYRASGAGGQHVNRTDSAVRIHHLPTGVVVQCQTQRSQHQNRDQAMKLLKSKLYERELEARRQKQTAVEDAKSDISWGSQIRSYVLHPYKLVKDHRTDFEHHNPDEVLDGGIDELIQEFLVQKLAGARAKSAVSDPL